jgi:hypothetical protein
VINAAFLKHNFFQLIEKSFFTFEKSIPETKNRLVQNYQHKIDDDKPLVSIIIPNFNYDHYLHTCVASVLNSSLINIEVILVDSSDQDSRESVLKSLLEDCFYDSRLKIYYRGAAKLGENRNFGISRAESDFVCSIDPDDKVHPHFLTVLFFRAKKMCLDISGAGMLAFGQVNETWHVKEQVTYLNLNLRNELASNSLFKKELWEQVGGFVDSSGDPHIHEDWRFWHRASKLGARIGNVDRPLSCIRIHGKNMSWQPDILLPREQILHIRQFNRDVRLSHGELLGLLPRTRSFIIFLLLHLVRSDLCKTALPKSLKTVSQDSIGEIIRQDCSNKKIAILSLNKESELCPIRKNGNQYFHLNSLLQENDWVDFYHFLLSAELFDEILIEESSTSSEE